MLKFAGIATAAALAVLLIGCDGGPVAKRGEDIYGPDATALAEKFAPVLYLVKQTPRCDTTFDTDPYRPSGVDAFFNQSNVQLLQGSKVSNPRPAAPDLAGMDGTNNFDIYTPKPTHEEDRCDYEDGYRMAGSANTVYSRVVHTNTETALQYWFFYYLNDWINVHEGDWEMIQLLFPSGSPADIVANNISPTVAGYSQHTGGHSLDWTAVEKAPTSTGVPGTHPVVYVASGSHSNYFEPGFLHAEVKYWFDNCDLAVGPTDSRAERLQMHDPANPIPNEYRLTPLQDAELNQDFVWKVFQGVWGQKSIPSFGGTKFPLIENPGRNAWWWNGQLKPGGNREDFCATRQTNPRYTAAGKRVLLEDGTPESLDDVKILAGDVVIFFINWFGSDVSLTLNTPGGTIDKNDDNVTYEKGDTYEVYRIENAPTGTWQISIEGTDLPPGGETVWWKAMDLPQICSKIDTTDATRDSDFDGLMNDADANDCNWDDDADGISDGCEVDPSLCPPILPPVTPPISADTPTLAPIGTPTPP